MEIIKIILAEDHDLMRIGTRHILEKYPDLHVLGEAENGEQASELIQKWQPDVAILDIRMPKMNGIEVVRQLKKISPDTRALMLTAYDDDEYVLALMEAGASGYLLKTATEKELVDSVRRIYSGQSILHPAIAMKVARFLAQSDNFVKQRSAAHLSPREVEILELAAKGLRNQAIADKLGINHRTVVVHFNNIFAKLGVSSRVEAVLEALSRHILLNMG